MAKTNRYPKLPLSKAWQYYWSVLFTGGVDWRADLESEIRKRLYFPGETSDFLGGDEPERVAPSWAEGLEIGFGDGFVEIKFQGKDFGKFPLFSYGLLKPMSN